jgi:hypothetical protein
MNTITPAERIVIIFSAILALTVTPLALLYGQDSVAQTSPGSKAPPPPPTSPPCL